MANKRVLIAVKTYPTISNKYEELVCTAGFLEDGSWVRIYPVPFRKKPYSEQYKKYDWIELDIVKNQSDFRPESYRPVSDDAEIKIIGHLGTENNWSERKKFVLNKVYYDLDKLIAEAKDKNEGTSLAVFKPLEVLDFDYVETDRQWNEKKLVKMKQLNLFENRKGKFQIVKKLPYKFRYIFKDKNGKTAKLMIEDWETGQLFWNCLDKYEDEKTACEKVREKYMNDFARTKDLYFFLGTTMRFHSVGPNPFIIIGTFHPKKDNQIKLFD